jgi:hypothetical protein
LKAQQYTVEALEQSIVKLASNPRTFADAGIQRHLELTMQLPDPPLISRPQQRQKSESAEGAKPVRLVIGGSD